MKSSWAIAMLFSITISVNAAYTELNTDQSRITFQSGQTYLISRSINVGDGSEDGTAVVFQPGAVIKFAPEATNGIFIVDSMDVTYSTNGDSPIILTSKDDDSFGEKISGSTGSPITLTNVVYLQGWVGNGGQNPDNFRIYCAGIGMIAMDPAYVLNSRFINCYQGISMVAGEVQCFNCQFINCYQAVSDGDGQEIGGFEVDFYNCLISCCSNAIAFNNPGGWVDGDSQWNEYDSVSYQSTMQYVTVDQVAELIQWPSGGWSDDQVSIWANNCIFTRTSDLYWDFLFYAEENDATYVTPSPPYPYVSLGGANYYIATNSSLHGSATTNILSFSTATTYAPQDGSFPDTNGIDYGYHYPVNEDSDSDGLADWWEFYWFGNYSHTGSELDAYGNTLLSDYQNFANGTATNDPNIIVFAIEVANNYVNTSSPSLSMNVTIGTPAYYSVLVDSTNFAGAAWTSYTSSNLTANLGSIQGWHELWVGLKGPAPGTTVTWQWKRLKLDTLAPFLVITNPVGSTVKVPMIQIYGYSPEPLDSIRYDITNALGFVTNQDAGVTDQYYDPNVWDFTTNYFECLDVPLTNGLNTITLHAADLAGNVTTTNISFTVDYSSKTNPPVVQITQPLNGGLISGTCFTLRGQVDDPTVNATAFITDTNGNTNMITGLVERNGRFWLEGIPLCGGTNSLSITVSDVVSNTTVTNLNFVRSPLILTMDPVGDDSQLWQPAVSLTGAISDASYAVWVNGVVGINNGDGTWSANDVPTTSGGVAIFDVTAYPSGEAPSSSLSGGGVNPQTPNAVGTTGTTNKPVRLYVEKYTDDETRHIIYSQTNCDANGNLATDQYGYIWMVDDQKEHDNVIWNDGLGGNATNHLHEVFTSNVTNETSGLRRGYCRLAGQLLAKYPLWHRERVYR